MTQRLLLDVNVLLALTWDGHVHHELAHERFSEVDSWSTTSITELGLLRLMLTEAVMGCTLSSSVALAQVQAFRDAPGWSWLADDVSPTAWRVRGDRLLGRRQVADLHLVNIAAANDSALATFDAGIHQLLLPDERHWAEIWG